MKTYKYPNTGACVALLTAAFVSQGDMFAQDDEDVFELSPFVVDGSRDTGYRATNTLTGSRLNTSLRDTAASVSVMTDQFIQDTGLNDLEELVKYTVGTKRELQDTNAGGDINNFLGAANPVERIRLRGIRASKGLDYFQAFIPDDSYRTERYDESRGPNGILFGISDSGGVVNTSTLNANTNKDSGRVRYSFGSYERNRADFSINKVLIDDKLGIAVAGLYQDNGGWRDYESDERERIYGAVTWQPTDRLSLRLKAEDGNHYETRVRPFLAADRFLAWYLNREKYGVDAVTFNVGRQSDFGSETSEFVFDGRDPQEIRSTNSDRSKFDLRALGLETYTARGNKRYIYNADSGSFYNIAGTWRTDSFGDGQVAALQDILDATSIQDVLDAGPSNSGAGSAVRILDYEQYGFDYPRHLNAGGAEMWREEDFDTYTFEADYKFTDSLYANFAHNQQRSDVSAQFLAGTEPQVVGDPNRLLRHPSNDANAPLAVNPYAGRLYFDSNWRYQTQDIDYEESRLALSYDFEFADSPLGRHRLAAGWSRRDSSQTLLGNYFGMLGNPYSSGTDFDNANNRVAVRTHLVEGNTDTYVVQGPPLGITSFVDDNSVTQQLGYIHENAGTLNGRSDIEVKSYILALQDYFFDGRLVTTFGWRQDKAENTAFGHVLDPLYGETITEDTSVEGYRVDEPIKANTRTAGAVYHLNDKFSLVANYATSIGLPEFRNVVFPGQGIGPPTEGEGVDFGVAFSAFENKLSGRIVYFDTEQLNLTTSGGGTRIISDPMVASMRALDAVRNYNSSFIVKADGNPYTDVEWAQEVDDLNGAAGGGVDSPTGAVNSFIQDNESKGYELTMTANLTDNWTLTLNASYTDRILSNYGREFAKSAGWQKDANGRFVNPVTVSAARDEAIGIDSSVLIDGSIHQRILDIAQRASGTIDLGGGATRVLDGNGALLINTASNGANTFQAALDLDESIAFRLWESLSGDNSLEENIDEREKRWGLNPYKFNVFTSYEITEGRFKNLTVGGGYRWLDGAIIGEDVNGKEFSNNSEGIFDLMMRYRQKLKDGRRLDYQLNVYNLLEEDDVNPVRYSVLDDNTSMLSRYDLPEPRTARATVTYSF